ncbi:MAG: outer membrane protein [Thiomicrorhabdus sp.]|nr:MAG: outer membrane protein [Thiomicrorhabdus sp.]
MKLHKVFNLKLSLLVLVTSSLLPAISYAEALDFKMCVDQVLSQNPEMDVSSARIQQAKFALGKAESSRLPQINFSITAANSNNALSVFGMKLQQQSVVSADFIPDSLNHPDAYTDFNTRLDMILPIWNGGKIGSYQDQAKAMIQAAKKGDVAVQQFLTYNVYQAYEAVHTARAYINVAKQAKKTADSFVKTTLNLVDEGVVVRSELLSAKVHQSMAETALLKAKGQEQIALDGLKILMNKTASDVIDVAGRVDLALPANSIEGLLKMAATSNPQLAAKREEAISYMYAENVAKADRYPSFNVMMRKDWNDEALSLSNGSYTVAGVVSWKVTDFGLTRNNIAMANASTLQQKASVKSAENQVRLDVLTYWRKMQIAQKQVQADNLAVQYANEAQDLIVKRYKGGVATITEVLVSQTQLDKAKAELVSAKYDVNIYKAKLRLATGTMDINQL